MEQLSTEVDQEDGDVSGGDAGDTGGLGDGGGAVAHQFLATFDGEGLDFIEVEVSGNLYILQTVVFFSLLFFALNIALEFDSNLYGFHNFWRKCSMWNNLKKVTQG